MRSTREGRRSVLATVLIAVAAVNTGNNLIYLVLSLMLAFLLLSLLVPKLILSKLHVDISFEAPMFAPIFAHEPTPVSITVVNGKRILPAYSVHVTSPVLRDHYTIRNIAGRGRVEKQTRAVFVRRGLHSRLDVSMESSFPFILFYAEKKMAVAKDIVVYPAYYDAALENEATFAMEGMCSLLATKTGDDILHIRQFSYGDDLKQVHWKASAKRVDLMVKEYALHESTKKTIIIGNGSPEAAGDFEKAISIAATLARRFIDRGDFVRLVSVHEVVPFGSGYEHLLRILDMLALVREERLGDDILLPDEDGSFILVLKSSGVDAQALLPEDSYIIHADTV